MGKQAQYPTRYAVLRFIRHGVTPRGFGLFFGIALGSLGLLITATVLFFGTIDLAHPKHPRVVLRAAAKALAKAANISVAVDLLEPGEYLGEQFDNYERALRGFGIGTRRPAPPLLPRSELSHVIFTNYPNTGQLYVGYVPTIAVGGPERQIRSDFMRTISLANMPGFVVPFTMSRDSAVTLAGVGSMFDAFVRGNTAEFPSLSARQLMYLTRRELAAPPASRMSWQLQGGVGLLILIGTAMIRIFLMNLFAYVRQVRRSMYPVRVEYLRYAHLGIALPRPSAWECFFSESHQAYAERYVRFLCRSIADFQRQLREERRGLKRAAELTARTEQFDQMATRLGEELDRQENLPIQVADDLKLMEDPTQPLDVRMLAFARIKSFLTSCQEQSRPADEAPQAEPQSRMAAQPDEESLLDRALAIDPSTWSEEQRQQLNRWFNEYEAHLDDESPATRMIALAEAIALAKMVRKEIGHQPRAAASPATNRRTLEDLAKNFSVADHLPPRIDHCHVIAILIWGLVKPGRGVAMFTGRRSAQVEQLRIAVVCKLGTAYDAAAFDAGLHWLVQHGVINQSRKKGREGYSLNFGSAASEAGTKIVQAVKKFTFSVREDLSRV